MPRQVATPGELESIIVEGMNDKSNSYYLFVSEWDEVSLTLLHRLSKVVGDVTENARTVNVIDIWDIPNGLDVIRSSIQKHKESISTFPLRSFSQLPMLVVLHKAFPRVVDYNGSIFVELGL